jgi:Uri superfamily endonuclease
MPTDLAVAGYGAGDKQAKAKAFRIRATVGNGWFEVVGSSMGLAGAAGRLGPG